MKKILLLIFITASTFVNAQLITNGLFAYFPFNGSIADEGPMKLASSCTSPFYGKDRNGNDNSAMSLISASGTSSPLNILSNDKIKTLIGGDYSFSLWYNPSDSYGCPCLKLSNHNYNNQKMYISNHKDWRMFTVVYKSGVVPTVFINGAETLTGYHGFNIESSLNSSITSLFLAPTSTLLIDDFLIYNRALSQTEIQMIYNQAITGVENNDNSTSVSFYPNPSQNQITLTGDVESVSILDTYGNVLITSVEQTVDISQLQKGMYIVKSKDLHDVVKTETLIKN